jgi:hypothetical protein
LGFVNVPLNVWGESPGYMFEMVDVCTAVSAVNVPVAAEPVPEPPAVQYA